MMKFPLAPPSGGRAGPPGSDPLPRNARGRLYHIDCGPGDLAPYIFTCGDPRRAQKIARRFHQVRLRRRNRAFLTYTGTYKDIPVSVMATGIGAPATAIAIVEAAQCVSPVTFIRLGSTGALQDYIALGDLVISAAALRDENTTHYYVPPGFLPPAHPAIISALTQAAVSLGVPHHVGTTCTTADFYAGQGRAAPGFPPLDPARMLRFREEGILNVEMEMSAYLALAAVATLPLRAGGACAVFNHEFTGSIFASARLKGRSERRLLDVGFLALELLAASDREQ
jgi:uridine phosphorylase